MLKPLICAVSVQNIINLYRIRQLPSNRIWREKLACTTKNPIPLYLGIVYFFLVYRREGTTNMMMFSRMLRRQGFYRVKNQNDPVYMKHGVGLGGIYVRIEHKKALIQVRDLGIQEEFTRVKKLENFINELEDQAYREKCFIVHKMRGSGS
jgi:hypothetical protein